MKYPRSPRATSPYPPTPPSPTLPPCPHARARPPHTSRCAAAQRPRCGCRACPALPLLCLPLSESGYFPPRPSAHVRPAPSQVRFVCLFRPVQSLPTGPSTPHPTPAWQIRLVSLCPLVHRASNPSCAGLFQAQAEGKTRSAQFNSTQTLGSAGQSRGAAPEGKSRVAYCSGRGGCHHLLVSLTRRWVTHFTQS